MKAKMQNSSAAKDHEDKAATWWHIRIADCLMLPYPGRRKAFAMSPTTACPAACWAMLLHLIGDRRRWHEGPAWSKFAKFAKFGLQALYGSFRGHKAQARAYPPESYIEPVLVRKGNLMPRYTTAHEFVISSHNLVAVIHRLYLALSFSIVGQQRGWAGDLAETVAEIYLCWSSTTKNGAGYLLLEKRTERHGNSK